MDRKNASSGWIREAYDRTYVEKNYLSSLQPCIKTQSDAVPTTHAARSDPNSPVHTRRRRLIIAKRAKSDDANYIKRRPKREQTPYFLENFHKVFTSYRHALNKERGLNSPARW